MSDAYNLKVATVLTACGIETFEKTPKKFLPSLDWLQQYLPLAVLKLNSGPEKPVTASEALPQLQQYLPLAVLKLIFKSVNNRNIISCNSTYRLRY